MYAIRCTEPLRKRMRVDVAPEVAPLTTTLLGDWYAGLHYFGSLQIILAVSARTLLPVVLPAQRARDLSTSLPLALSDVLLRLGIPAPTISAECARMDSAIVAKTADRRILGTMNDFVRMFEPSLSLVDAALELAEAPCGPIGMESPNRLTVHVLNAANASGSRA